MQREYGRKRGESVFYASKNSGQISGVDAADMAGPEWDELQRLFGEWIEEERAEPEHGGHAEDAILRRVGRAIYHAFARDDGEGRFATVSDPVLRAAMAGPSAEDEAKLSKAEVDYSPGKGEDRCKNCAHHIVEDDGKPASLCELVDGQIDPEYWCKRFLISQTRPAEDLSLGLAASVLFVAPSGKVLLLKRSPTDDHRPGEWGLPGGKADGEETAEDAARREAAEEVGDHVPAKLTELAKQKTPREWDHVTYLANVPEEFEPTLSDEHTEHSWAEPGALPEPRHPALDDLCAKAAARMASDAEQKRDESGKFSAQGASHSAVLAHHGWKQQNRENTVFTAGLPRTFEHSAYPGHTITTAEKSRLGTPREKQGRLWEHEEKKQGKVSEYKDQIAKGNSSVSLHSHLRKFHANGGANDESKTERDEHEGKLSDRTREDIGREGSTQREEMPESAFLGPSHTYPVQEKRDGKYVYTRNLLLAAERRAVSQGRRDLARKAKAIREREFGDAEDCMTAVDDEMDDGGEDESFARLDHSLAHKKGVHNAAALAAYIGRKNGKIPGGDAALTLAADRAPGRIALKVTDHLFSGIAFDRETTRSKTVDGRLRISEANISKANVCPYYGSEIPDFESLGLQPDKIYRLYRDPVELKKAASTFDEVPILDEHRPSTADDHPKDLTIGTTGTGTRFDSPHLKTSLTFWATAPIDDIEEDERRQLSASYRYVADMTPGTTPDGEPFDGRMTQLVGNHVALVRDGRAGPTVMVGDSAIMNKPYAREGFRWSDLPKMAADSRPAKVYANDEWSDAARKAAAAARKAHAAGGGVGPHREASEAHANAHQEHMSAHKSAASGAERVAHHDAANKHELASFEHKYAAENGGREDPFHKGRANRLSNAAVKASNAVAVVTDKAAHPPSWRVRPAKAEDDWSPEARAAAAKARKEHAAAAKHHKGEAERHFNAMHEHRSRGAIGAEREARAKWSEHKKLAEHHEVKSREEQVPTGTGRSIGKSKVNRVTAGLLQGRH